MMDEGRIRQRAEQLQKEGRIAELEALNKEIESEIAASIGYSSMSRMSMGYGASLTIGLVSLPFLGIALGGIVLLARGGDPLDAINGSGLICFIAAYALLFLMRFILWKRSPPAVRNAVRMFLTLVLVSLFVATGYTLVRTVEQTEVPGWLLYVVALAALCQIGTVLWVVHYRREL